MKALRIGLLGFVALLAIIMIIGLFAKKDYHVEREITINKPVAEVFDYVKHLKNQDNYSKWVMMDPAMAKTYRGEDATVGFVSAWESTNDEVGVGEQEITAIKEGERVDFVIRFFKPFESMSPAYMTTIAVEGNQTKVVWGFNGHMNFPTNLMLVFMDFENMIGDDLSTGLANLKVELEK